MRLTGKTALVTGGAIGIGRAIAVALTEEGAHVAVTYLSHEPDGEFAAAVEQASGAPLRALRLDLTDEAAATDGIRELAEQLGGIDILVNNAGGLIGRKQVAEMDRAFWDRVLEVNLTSAFLATRAALPHLKDGAGRIINISSVAGHNGGSGGTTAYATAKAAIFGFTRGLSKEVAGRGITVNTLAPGMVLETPFHETFTPPEAQQASIKAIPVGRAGIPTDIASAVLWLAGDDTGFVTGSTIDLNGGQYFA